MLHVVVPSVTLPPDMPEQMEHLPRDSVGRPVPFFVGYVDGKPDFRVMDPDAWRKAMVRDLCWVCGRKMKPTSRKVFVAGPMCLVNGTSAEPPAHYRCAEWCVRACPFLLNPNKVRRESNMPENVVDAGGIAIMRNPGVIALVESGRYWIEDAGNGYIVKFDQVRSVEWFREGRTATRPEVDEALASGLPALEKVAREEGHGASEALAEYVDRCRRWLPAA